MMFSEKCFETNKNCVRFLQLILNYFMSSQVLVLCFVLGCASLPSFCGFFCCFLCQHVLVCSDCFLVVVNCVRKLRGLFRLLLGCYGLFKDVSVVSSCLLKLFWAALGCVGCLVLLFGVAFECSLICACCFKLF